MGGGEEGSEREEDAGADKEGEKGPAGQTETAGETQGKTLDPGAEASTSPQLTASTNEAPVGEAKVEPKPAAEASTTPQTTASTAKFPQTAAVAALVPGARCKIKGLPTARKYGKLCTLVRFREDGVWRARLDDGREGGVLAEDLDYVGPGAASTSPPSTPPLRSTTRTKKGMRPWCP